ncbi:hypothetical protein GCM10011322_27710 [Salinarimonas ramus]|uniref:Anti-sigma factor NepR domain-containing protein n=1 Tax=Salinarimonas ramus TaxID=690164 RepID=A0A917V549_9HYPH|nr:hypothetical protein GCM10011322_27710 [Salinarimonas ramus]
MTDRPRRKWAEIQVELFQDAAARHAAPGASARFEALLARLVPPIRPGESDAASRVRRDAPPDGAAEPTDRD